MKNPDAARSRLCWLRAHHLGQPMPWFKRGFAATEYHVRHLIWKMRNA